MEEEFIFEDCWLDKEVEIAKEEYNKFPDWLKSACKNYSNFGAKSNGKKSAGNGISLYCEDFNSEEINYVNEESK